MLIGPTVAILLAVHVQEHTAPPSGLGETPPLAQTSSRTQDGEEIEQPRKKKHVAPEWPENARRAGLNGAVILECVIGVDGNVNRVTVIKGFRSLAEAAEKAVRKWRYTPTLLRGNAVPVIMTVTVNFKLQGPPKRADVMASLNDSDPEVRRAAILWLTRYRPITAAQQAAVKRALKDPDEQVRKAARDARAELGVK